nr:MAG TPA: steroid receptor coactivator [Caudoviricetes sp.]
MRWFHRSGILDDKSKARHKILHRVICSENEKEFLAS